MLTNPYQANVVDTWRWQYGDTSAYTTKSGYQLFFQTKYAHIISVNSNQQHFWKIFWSIKGIQPKVHLFSYRLVSHTLPLRSRLARFIPQIIPICPLCQDFQEMETHIFFHCTKVKQIWQIIGLHCQFVLYDEDILTAWNHYFNMLQSEETRRLFLYTIWSI